jgi:hypothetical protein
MCKSISQGGQRCEGYRCGSIYTVTVTDPAEKLARARRARAKIIKAARIDRTSPDYEAKSKKLQNNPDLILLNRTIAIADGLEVAGDEGDEVPKASQIGLDPNRKRGYTTPPQPVDFEPRSMRTSTTLNRHDVQKLAEIMVDDEGNPLSTRARATRLRELVLSVPPRSPLGEAQVRHASDKLRSVGNKARQPGRNQSTESRRIASSLYFNFTQAEYERVQEWAGQFKLAPTEYLRRRALSLPLEPSDGWITVNKHEERMAHLFSDSHAQNYEELVRNHLKATDANKVKIQNAA